MTPLRGRERVEEEEKSFMQKAQGNISEQ